MIRVFTTIMTMDQLPYCVICLGTEIKMFHMKPEILRLYKELISVHGELTGKHLHTCYECVSLLHKYRTFKAKCYKAYKILCNINPDEPFQVSTETLKNVDRKQNKLESVLTTCTTSNYYIPNQKTDYCESNKQLYIGVVKTESGLIKIQKQCNEQTFNAHEGLQSLTADPIAFDDYVSNTSDTKNKEIKSGSESFADNEIDDDDYTLDMLKTGRWNNNSKNDGLCILSTKEESNLEMINILKPKSHDSYSDGKSKCPNNVDNKNTICSTKQKKIETINKKNIKIMASKKGKSNKSLTRNIKLGCIINRRNIKKKRSQNNALVSLIVTDKTNKDVRFSINSSIFKEYMTIIELSPEDAKNELLLRKESRNYKMNLHKCNLCFRGFISDVTYQTHMKKHSLEYGILKCDICQLSFTESRYLSNHRIVCHTRKFFCKLCPYVCFGANQARAHIQSHIGKKYTCKECGEIFRFPNSLSTHMRLRHSVELVCEFCGSTFASAKGMDCHKRLLHRKEKNEHLGPPCEDCDVHFASELAWKRHRVLCSRHEVRDGCGVCGATFADAVGLRAHLREHGPLPTTWNARLRTKPPAAYCATPYMCNYCNKELRNKKEYKIHMASEHPRVDTNMQSAPGSLHTTPPVKWVCEVCGKMFKHHSLFISHQRKHTGEKPYSCPECGKRFKRADAVKAHRPLHTKEYKFKCHLCDKAYGDRGKLNRHVKGHLGIRPYECLYCDKSFLYQCVANAHIKYVHCKEPYPKRDRSKRANKVKTK